MQAQDYSVTMWKMGTPAQDIAVFRREQNMKSNDMLSSNKSFACETCPMRRKAEENPRTLMARLWRWHTGWCPGWKAYHGYLP
jgi:hypothetical protein